MSNYSVGQRIFMYFGNVALVWYNQSNTLLIIWEEINYVEQENG